MQECSVVVQGAWGVCGLHYTAHGGVGRAHGEHLFPVVIVGRWVVVFLKRLRYFWNVDAGCLKRTAGSAMSEVQRATAGASTSTAEAALSAGCYLCLGAMLNAHVHLCMVVGVVAPGRQGLVFRGAQVDEVCVERVQALTWCGVRNL